MVAVEEEKKKSPDDLLGLIESLDSDELRLVHAICVDELPGDFSVSTNAVFRLRRQFFELLVQGDVKAGFRRLAHQISRGIGDQVFNPKSGSVTTVTQETWELGPRGQWYHHWQPIINSVLKKIQGR